MKIRKNSKDDISSWTEALDLAHPSEILFRPLIAVYQENKWKISNQCSHTLKVLMVFAKANSKYSFVKKRKTVAEMKFKIYNRGTRIILWK